MNRVNEIVYVSAESEICPTRSVAREGRRKPVGNVVIFSITYKHTQRLPRLYKVISALAEKHERNLFRRLRTLEQGAVDLNVDELDLLARENLYEV